jgi:SAM-dependent MidA family methyltransferase
MGLLERAGALGANADDQDRQAIADAVERLAGPDAMGELFKVLKIGRP